MWKSNLPAAKRGIMIVGVPIGTSQFIHERYNKVLLKEEKLLQSIPMLPSLQSAWLLLYYCAVPRFNHLLRSLAPADVERSTILHDSAILSCFRTLFRISDKDV